MRSARFALAFVLTTSVGLFACGSDDSSNDGGAGDGSALTGGTSGDAAALGGTGGTSSDAAAAGGMTGGLGCFMGGSNGTCTPAEESTYDNCVFGQCQASISACFGPGILSGTYGGTCGSWLTCVAKCGCNGTGNNAACLLACGAPSAECAQCEQAVGTCTDGSTCTKPACMQTVDAGAPGLPPLDASFTLPDGLGDLADALGGSHTCADLLACCSSITDAQNKFICMSAYTSASPNGDAVCSAGYQGLKVAGICK